MDEYFKKQEEIEETLNFRHPWFNVFYNYLVLVCVLALMGGFIWWGIDLHTRQMADEMTATAMASYQAEQQAAEDAKAQELAAIQASEEHIMVEEAKTIAKALFGIRKFVDKYGYSNSDLETYIRCIFNRCDATGKSVQEVVSQKDQFLGYEDGNQIVKEYYDLAIKLVEEWHHEEVKPCDSSYQWAELNSDGIWLKNDFNADGYSRRWHA